jgi:hypothetical protein
MKKRLLVITDCTDVASQELHAAITSHLDRLEANNVSIEPIVHVKEFSVLHGSFSARLIAESYIPDQLTILAVVNPLNTSNTKRARIAGRLKNGIQFVGANTGIFSWLIKDYGLKELVETDRTGLSGNSFISFGGKYIHAPIAATLAATGDLSKVKVAEFKKSDLVAYKYRQGSIVHIDNFGVSKLLYAADDLIAVPGQKFLIIKDGEIIGTATFCHSMKELTVGTLAIYKGSSLGMLELGKVRHLNTAQTLGLEIGDILVIQSIEQ